MVYSDFWLHNKYVLPRRFPVTNRAITSLHPSHLQRGLIPAVVFSASLHYRSVTKHSIVQPRHVRFSKPWVGRIHFPILLHIADP
jgi:hypothetical protein